MNSALAAKGWTEIPSREYAAIFANEVTRNQQTPATFYTGFGGWRWGGLGTATTTLTHTRSVSRRQYLRRKDEETDVAQLIFRHTVRQVRQETSTTWTRARRRCSTIVPPAAKDLIGRSQSQRTKPATARKDANGMQVVVETIFSDDPLTLPFVGGITRPLNLWWAVVHG